MHKAAIVGMWSIQFFSTPFDKSERVVDCFIVDMRLFSIHSSFRKDAVAAANNFNIFTMHFIARYIRIESTNNRSI